MEQRCKQNKVFGDLSPNQPEVLQGRVALQDDWGGSPSQHLPPLSPQQQRYPKARVTHFPFDDWVLREAATVV